MNRTQPHLVDLFSIGESYEGRPLYVLQVRGKKKNHNKVTCRITRLVTERSCPVRSGRGVVIRRRPCGSTAASMPESGSDLPSASGSSKRYRLVI